MSDFQLSNVGSICILYPRTQRARDWVADHLDEHQSWCAGVVIEPRYVDAIVEGAREDGLEVT